jgi:hypothetical protein
MSLAYLNEGPGAVEGYAGAHAARMGAQSGW